MPPRIPLLIITLLLSLAACDRPVPWQGREVSGVFPDLAFTLTGEDGQAVSAEAFHGKLTLLFFGFTNCPGVCPATLAQLGAAIDLLGDAGRHVQVLLVSVDPPRDTPDAMRAYTDRFGPWLHGLTGSEASLRAVNTSYKVGFQALPADAQGAYDVQHSARVFAFDERGRCRLLLSEPSQVEGVVSDLRKLLAERGMI